MPATGDMDTASRACQWSDRHKTGSKSCQYISPGSRQTFAHMGDVPGSRHIAMVSPRVNSVYRLRLESLIQTPTYHFTHHDQEIPGESMGFHLKKGN